MYGSSRSSSYASTFDIERLRALNLNTSVPVLQELLKPQNINISSFKGRPIVNDINIQNGKNDVYYESPLTLPSELIATAKDYEWVYKTRAKQLLNVQKAGKSLIMDIAHQTITPSMFNSSYGVNTLGLMSNVPLLNDAWTYTPAEQEALLSDEEKADVNQRMQADEQTLTNKYSAQLMIASAASGTAINQEMADNYAQSIASKEVQGNRSQYVSETLSASGKITSNRAKIAQDLSNCSIRELCTLSKKTNSILGQARYKYADFMYCKDLGKVPNNRLITLRRFAHPVGDHIFEMTNRKYAKEETYSFKQPGDVGRLVAWFDTDDNKLEDIIKFSYHATWKQLTSQIEEKQGTADDSSSGILGMIANSLNPTYNSAVNAGIAGNHSLIGYLGSKITQNVTQGIGKNNELLTNYDKNKVYEPKDRIQSTHIYDGALEFNHQFTLNFSYVLRGYENINPKSAFLDLIGNILEVTYKRGKFWGGARKTIGPNANVPMFNKVHHFIDDAWAKAGGFMDALVSGGIGFEEILGWIGQGISGFIGSIVNTAKEAAANPQEFVQKIYGWSKDFMQTHNISGALKGYLKNAVGRPQLIAWQSLLDGGDVGLWHVTIGNPKNPIVAMGNLILEDATITQYGPLGLDDFPSELKVSVTLKHARPRDITDIGKMYTKGLESLYKGFANHRMSDFYKMEAAEEQAIRAAEDSGLNGAQNPADATDYANGQTPEAIREPAEKELAKEKAEKEKKEKANTELKNAKKKAEEAKQKAEEAAKEAESNKDDKGKQTAAEKAKKEQEAADKALAAAQKAAGVSSEEPQDAKEILNSGEAVSASQKAYNVSLQLANDDMLVGSADDYGPNDGPWVLNDEEARIVQSNNYSFEMLRLNISEMA